MAYNFSTLRLFARVARTGSFTAAGREVGLSQPSVSRIISDLEKDLGVLLFARTTHAVRPTEAGEEYLSRIEPILFEIEEANHIVRGTGELRGRLRIGAATSFARREIIPILPGFMAMHPELRIDLVMTDTRQNLVDEAIDVAFRYGPLEDPTMVAKKVASPPRIIAASPEYLARAGVPQRPIELLDHQIILGPSSARQSGWAFTKDGTVQSICVKSRLMVTVNEGTTVAALSGLGIINTGLWGCRAEIESGALVRLLPGWNLGSIDVNALFAAGKGTKPSARAFASFLRDAVIRNV